MVSTILVVDDEPGVRGMVAAVLEDEGHTVRTAGSGTQALDALKREHFDLVVLDIMLPGMDGRDVYRRLGESPCLACIPVIMMSVAEVPHEVSGRLIAFLAKPFDIDTLLAIVSKALASSSITGS